MFVALGTSPSAAALDRARETKHERKDKHVVDAQLNHDPGAPQFNVLRRAVVLVERSLEALKLVEAAQDSNLIHWHANYLRNCVHVRIVRVAPLAYNAYQL